MKGTFLVLLLNIGVFFLFCIHHTHTHTHTLFSLLNVSRSCMRKRGMENPCENFLVASKFKVQSPPTPLRYTMYHLLTSQSSSAAKRKIRILFQFLISVSKKSVLFENWSKQKSSMNEFMHLGSFGPISLFLLFIMSLFKFSSVGMRY